MAFGVAQMLITLLVLALLANTLERRAIERKQAQFEAYIGRMKDDLARVTLSFAEWNVAYAFASSGDRDTIGKFFGPELLTSDDVDFVRIVDPAGRELWASLSREAAKDLGRPGIEVFRKAAEAPLPKGLEEGDVESGNLLVGERAAVFAFAPITDDSGEAPARGSLFMLRVLDSRRLEDFAIDGAEGLAFQAGMAPEAGRLVATEGARGEGPMMVAYSPFAAKDESILGYWRLSEVREWTIAARYLSVFLLAIIGISVVLMHLVVLRLIRREVLAPVAAIRDHLDRFSIDMRVDRDLAFAGRGEIAKLSDHINGLISRVTVQADALDRLAGTDGLTGIANRRRLDAVLDSWRGEVPPGIGDRRSRKAQPNPVACVLIDVDFFKRYNDRYGHGAGDHVLRLVAKALEGSVRGKDDLACRYGGEEFVLLLPGVEEEGGLVAAERARRAVEEFAIPHEDSEAASVVTISAGVASAMAGPGFDPAALLDAADRGLYRAKAEGRNRVCVAPPAGQDA